MSDPLTVTQLMAALFQHRQHLPPGAISRWAFLVTFNELASLVDEMQANPQYGLQFNPTHAEHIKAGRAALIIDNTPVLPELLPVTAEPPPQSN